MYFCRPAGKSARRNIEIPERAIEKLRALAIRKVSPAPASGQLRKLVRETGRSVDG